jgi:hypothetical protein
VIQLARGVVCYDMLRYAPSIPSEADIEDRDVEALAGSQRRPPHVEKQGESKNKENRKTRRIEKQGESKNKENQNNGETKNKGESKTTENRDKKHGEMAKNTEKCRKTRRTGSNRFPTFQPVPTGSNQPVRTG